MDQEVAKLKIETNRLKRRIIFLEEAVSKLQRLIEPPEVQKIRAMEDR